MPARRARWRPGGEARVGHVVIVAAEAQARGLAEALPGEQVTVLTDRRHLLADLTRLAPAADLVLELGGPRSGEGPGDDEAALVVPALCAALGLPCAGGGARTLALCGDRGALAAMVAPLGVELAEPEPGSARCELLLLPALGAGAWRVAAAVGTPPGAAGADLHETSARLAERLATRWGLRDTCRLVWRIDGRPRLLELDPRPSAQHLAALVAAVRARAPEARAARGPVYVNGPVYVARAGAKGHGLFAARALRKGERVEEMPVVVLNAAGAEALEKVPILGDYEFVFGEEDVAMAIGNAAFINYANTPNVDLVRDLARRTITIQALRDVAPGEELFYRYRCGAWFDVAE